MSDLECPTDAMLIECLQPGLLPECIDESDDVTLLEKFGELCSQECALAIPADLHGEAVV